MPSLPAQISDHLNHFIEQAGWAGALREPLQADWSVKTFERLQKDNGETACLIVWNESADPFDRFLTLADVLRKEGLSAPEIYAADPENRFVLCEDFGDQDVSAALETGADQKKLYGLAADVLDHIRLTFQGNDLDLPAFHGGRLHKTKDFLVSYYLKGSPEQVEEYNALWDTFEAKQPPCPKTFIHGDYHPHNLMWLPDRKGLKVVGLIDFAGAMWGPAPYDLVNLLEDIRRDVPEEIKPEMRARYCAQMSKGDRAVFDLWYDILAFQFHARVIGQILKLEREDLKIHLPRLERFLKEHLEKDVFAPFKEFFSAQGFSL